LVAWAIAYTSLLVGLVLLRVAVLAYVAAYERLGGSVALIRFLGYLIADAIFAVAVAVVYMVPLFIYGEAAHSPADIVGISIYSVFFVAGAVIAMLPVTRARHSMASVRSRRR
jgi:hypothetical protein